MTTRTSALPVDRTLRQIVVGFRYVAAVWITVVGIIAIVSWHAKPAVIIPTLLFAWLWAIATGLVSRDVMRGLPFLLADLAVTSWTAAAPAFTDQTDGATFSGGYPFSTVLVWAYAFGIPGGVGAGAFVSVIALFPGDSDLTTDLTTALIYLAGGGVAGWAFNMLRRSEGRRIDVEHMLANERSERIRSEEKAEMAAHLHDSVLQTLALIQKRSHEPGEVGSLARQQERELRNWLYNASAQTSESLAGALEAACAAIEDRHSIGVELVTVGDVPLDDNLRALVAATTEALTNAAKFSGDDELAVYCEVIGMEARIFVRDRGQGFDPSAVEEDRKGIRESIVGRVKRRGGDAFIRSSPGTGTEIELTIAREES
ncbi:MAG: sensor histidine kinase [Acidimicrobiia bacterium]